MAEAEAPIGRGSGEALQAFAEHRGLTYTEKAELPKSTPLAIAGQVETSDIVSGELPGFRGLIGTYTFTQSSEGNEPQVTVANVALTRVPESIHYLPSLTAHDATKMGFAERLIGAGGLIPLYDRLEFESIKFNHTYRVGVLRNQNESFVRQLFAPSFVDFMAERAPEGCYFDLMWGMLLVASRKPLTTDAEIEEFCGFVSEVAARIRNECAESEAVGADPESLVSEGQRKIEADRDEWVEKVERDEPPETVADAAKGYRRLALGRPGTWITSLVLALLLALLISGIGTGFAAAGGLEGAPLILAGLGLFALVFAWSFWVGVRGAIRDQTAGWGLVAFVRGYGKQRGLEWESGAIWMTRQSQTFISGIGAAAVRGRIPGADRDGTLLFSIDPSEKGRKMKGTMGLMTPFAGPESETLLIFPRGLDEAPTPLGGFLINGAKGVHESDADRAHRERTQRLGEQVLEGDEQLGVFIEGGELAIYGRATRALDWDAESVDGFAKRAAEVAGRLEASLAAA